MDQYSTSHLRGGSLHDQTGMRRCCCHGNDDGVVVPVGNGGTNMYMPCGGKDVDVGGGGYKLQ